MERNNSKWPFSLAARASPQTIRDKDNAQPRVAPPQQVRVPHPQLAPPGMSGIKTSRKLALPGDPPKPKRQEFESGFASREFKSLVQSPSGKDRSRDR
jgi:hypothetical protein